MANFFTAIPEKEVPDLPAWMHKVVVVADLCMELMLSRPGGLSLRNSWVTPATMVLSAILCVASLLGVVMMLVGHLGWPTLLIAASIVLLIFLAVGCGSIVLVGWAQRRSI